MAIHTLCSTSSFWISALPLQPTTISERVIQSHVHSARAHIKLQQQMHSERWNREANDKNTTWTVCMCEYVCVCVAECLRSAVLGSALRTRRSDGCVSVLSVSVLLPHRVFAKYRRTATRLQVDYTRAIHWKLGNFPFNSSCGYVGSCGAPSTSSHRTAPIHACVECRPCIGWVYCACGKRMAT